MRQRTPTRRDGNPAAEAALAATGGAVLAGAVGALAGAAIPAALVGAANGALGGWRQVYDWRSAKGAVAFALDSTWALGTTAAGLVAHALGEVRGDAGYVDDLSRRKNRHVYRAGSNRAAVLR